MNILVTGGAGFIGSNFVKFMLKKYPKYNIVNIDALTQTGNLSNLKEIVAHPNYTFIKADIRDRKTMNRIFDDYAIEAVVNFADESYVENSDEDPERFLETNVIGTQVLLDLAKRYWGSKPDSEEEKPFKSGVKFLQVSTGEVYGELGETEKFVETMPLRPNSPYSASKAGADFMVRAYYETFGLPVTITRCSDNYGPYQFLKQPIPLLIQNAFKDQPLPVYGEGSEIRDWLHVLDHCAALDVVLHKGEDGEIYNIGGNIEIATIDMVELILATLRKPKSLIEFSEAQSHSSPRYIMDNTKITTELGWSPTYTFKKGLHETIDWYLENPEWVEQVVSGEYQKVYSKLYSRS